MKKSRLLGAMCACLSAFCLSTSTHATPVLYFDFTNDGVLDAGTTVDLGDSVIVDLYISGIDSTHGGLVGWGSEIGFNNTLLSATSFSIDPVWSFPYISNNINNSGGTVELGAGSFFSPSLTGTIKLAEITFDTIDSGLASLSTSEIFASQPSFDAFVGADGHVYDDEISYMSAGIEITAVPIPAAVWLFSSGLLGLLGISRQKKAS